MIESGVTFDLAQLVMDAEIARLVKRSLQGMPVTDETLAVDDIVGVGSFGDFLSLDATLRHMRDHSQPKLLDRRVREDWTSAGASDLYERARAAAQEDPRRARRAAAAGRRGGGGRGHPQARGGRSRRALT